MVSNTCDYFDRFSRVAHFSYLQKVGFEIRFSFSFFNSLCPDSPTILCIVIFNIYAFGHVAFV